MFFQLAGWSLGGNGADGFRRGLAEELLPPQPLDHEQHGMAPPMGIGR
jgi:hypothetical protein